MEEKTTTVLTAEKAKELREQLKAFRAQKLEERALRKERREERAEEIARHREVAAKAQSAIDEFNKYLDDNCKVATEVAGKIDVLRVHLKQLQEERRKISKVLNDAYADRRDARGALSALSAEIRGPTAE